MPDVQTLTDVFENSISEFSNKMISSFIYKTPITYQEFGDKV